MFCKQRHPESRSIDPVASVVFAGQGRIGSCAALTYHSVNGTYLFLVAYVPSGSRFDCSMNSRLSVSAPGKIILHGEHSVVYGKKAIACAIDARVKIDAAVIPGNRCSLVVNMPAVNFCKFAFDCNDLKTKVADCENYEEIMHIIDNKCCSSLGNKSTSDFTKVAISCILFAYCKTFCCKEANNCTISISVETEIPIGAGLGSSAAFNTSIACIFLLLSQKIQPECSDKFSTLKKKEDLDAINALAYQMERIVHKSPSGIDNSVATFGGAVVFQNGAIRHLEKMPILNLLIVNSKVPRSTKTLVSKVQQYQLHHSSIISPILDSIDAIVSTAELILGKLYDSNGTGDTEILSDWGRLIETNQSLLAALGVSHSSLDKICSISRKFHCPAKLTGAGGGGCVVIFLDLLKHDPESISHLKKELESSGYECSDAAIGGDGLLVKTF